mgnify:CR=1 FL=1
MLRIDTPIQTIDKFSEVSGLTKRQIESRLNDGRIPFISDGSRGKLVNVAKYAQQLLLDLQTKQNQAQPTNH